MTLEIMVAKSRLETKTDQGRGSQNMMKSKGEERSKTETSGDR
jgi:hypothetical protein